MNKYLFTWLMLVSLLASGCSVDEQELVRKTSPDGVVDFVLTERNAGATTAYVYAVYLVSNAQAPERDHELFIADHVEGLDVAWRGNKTLAINYTNARIYRFTNFWLSRQVDNFKYVVEITLTKNPPTRINR